MRKLLFTISLLFSFLYTYNDVFAQQLPANLRFNKFTTENGLSDDHVVAILKDEKGYLWMATQNGFDRFDGVEFKTFLHNPFDSNSVLSNFVSSLAEDSLGRIWVSTYNGLSMYNPATGKFWNYIPPEKEFVKSIVPKVLTAHNGSVWFSTWNRLNTINLQTFQITSYLIDSLPVNLGGVSIDNFFEDHEGNFWFDSYHGLSLFSRINHTVSLLDKNFGLSFLYDDGEGHAWLGAWQSAFREYDFHKKKFTDYFFDDKSTSTATVRNISLATPVNYPGLESLLWLATEQELAVFDTRTKRFINYYSHNPSIQNSLPVNGINYIFFDGKNQLWIGTNAGLCTLNVNQLCISSFYFSEYPNRNVNRIRKDKKDTTLLWLSIEFGGLYGVNRYTGNIVHHFSPGTKKPYDALNVFADFVQDADGIIWLAGSNGLMKYNPETKKYKFIKAPLKNLPGQRNDFYSLLLNPDGTIWFGASAGLGKFFPATETFRYYFHYTPGSGQHFETHFVRSIMKDFSGNIWLFNNNDGLLVFDPSSEKFTNKHIQGVNLMHVPSHDITQSPDGTIWLTTGEQLVYKRINDTAFHLLYNSEIDSWMYRLTCDKNNNLFIGMQTGLLKYEKQTGRFTKYTTIDGLAENQNYIGLDMEDGDRLYIRGRGYVSEIDTKRINKQYVNSNLVFESLAINAKDTAIDFDLYKNKALLLGYKQNQLTVYFRLLNLADAQQVRYAYKLDGWDKAWISSNRGNYAGYSNLPGGDYILHVKAINPDGTENPRQAIMLIHIDLPFWKTWWFYSLCALAVITLLYFIYTLRMQHLLAVEKIRSKISRDLHDDVGSALTSINIWSDVAGRQFEEDVAKSVEYIGRIRNSSQNMLDNMNDIIWAINPVNDTLEKVLIRMKLYASEVLEPKNISFLFTVDNEIKSTIIPMQYRREWYLIFKEAINNAAKYSCAKNIEVRLLLYQHNLILHIKDDGKGFLFDANNQGNGLRNMLQRAAQMKADLKINSTPGNGTEIILRQKFT